MESEYFTANVQLTVTVDFVRVNWIITEDVNRTKQNLSWLPPPLQNNHYSCMCLITWLNTATSHSYDWHIKMNFIHLNQQWLRWSKTGFFVLQTVGCPLTINIFILYWRKGKLNTSVGFSLEPARNTCNFRGIRTNSPYLLLNFATTSESFARRFFHKVNKISLFFFCCHLLHTKITCIKILIAFVCVFKSRLNTEVRETVADFLLWCLGLFRSV